MALSSSLPSPTLVLILCFLFLLLQPFSSSAQSSNQVIAIGSSLLANNDNSYWTSPSGDFAFGFQNINGPSAGYLLSIWFNKIPEKTIVWSANPQTPAPEGSKIELTGNSFQLTNPNGSQIWSAGLTRSSLSNAAMLDSGNFVILGNSSGSTTLWQSFDQPTDTILPTQTLSQGMRLVARLFDTNFSYGRFKLDMQTDGNLVLNTRSYPFDGAYSAYWSSDSVGSGFQLIYNETGYIYLIARNGTILMNPFPSNSNNNSTQFYLRTILDYDGVLRQYVYPKSVDAAAGRSMNWSVLSFIPSDICMSITQDKGAGACGYNSICVVGADQRPTCECPSGYTPFDLKDPLSGCKPNFVPQDCDADGQESYNFGFVDLTNTNWALNDYEFYNPVTEDMCREACLSDCYCYVVIFNSGRCWKKRSPVSNGKVHPSLGGKALVKIRIANLTTPPNSDDLPGKIFLGSVLFGSSMFLNIVLILATFWVIKRKKTTMIVRPHSTGRNNLRFFSYKELEIATMGFKDELGRGASAVVYKGVLKNGSSEEIIAVKTINSMDMGESTDREFKAEMGAISRTNHKNLVQLLGYCDEGNNRLLVYEYMINGSLAGFIFGNSRPSWNRRVQLAFGIARGLSYLHEECSKQIIHCDIKPQNILLDETFTARICDFGLAKLLKTDQSRTTTMIRGTKGYVAPEWFKKKPVTIKVDVYSFGIMLLEIVCCRRNVDEKAKCEGEIILSDWAIDCFKDGKIYRLVEDDEEAMNDFGKVERFVMIALWCIQEEPSLRPEMKKVSQMLEGSVAVSIPPDPCSFNSSF
ncbi:G-type lectin S-receptor-like serine/threonine-protein kinase LECRK3 [Impatiens glandulifera]|uniref:G-type lectin S-receptor-like serine/threonine-protein kinase LECRK3 n=1 Tax=Impatiens glandulifera TaxID=253017 RepID=UPI001FB17B82|nr:G-type lectin S-receptor-like serine/threonine-protein kinase LECRK3 [Impatiens glandulifera]